MLGYFYLVNLLPIIATERKQKQEIEQVNYDKRWACFVVLRVVGMKPLDKLSEENLMVLVIYK